jgi:hypothetical protein
VGGEQRHKIAQDLLDFPSVRSVCGGLQEATMDRDTIEPAVRIVLTEAVTVSMDIEQLIYEAGRLQDAASLPCPLSLE